MDKWFKVGQIRFEAVNHCYSGIYNKVGQVGQNRLTHFYFLNSFIYKDLKTDSTSGSCFHGRDGMDKRQEREELLQDFLRHGQITGRREQAITGLRSRVPKFFTFLDESGLTLLSVGISEALDYQLWLIETGRRDGEPYTMRTVHSYLSAASSFYEYLKSCSQVLSNPFREIRKVRVEEKLPDVFLSEKQMAALLDEMEHFDREDNLKNQISRYRLHIICELLYSTGLRISEAAALRNEDVDLFKGTVRVLEGKGGLSRTVLLNDYCRQILAIYTCEIRPLILTQWHDENLLFGTAGRDAFVHVTNRGIKRTAEDLNLPPVRAHGFRHALGYHLLRAGCPVRDIQNILGHKALKNTEIYTRVDKEDLKEVLDKYHPRHFGPAE